MWYPVTNLDGRDENGVHDIERRFSFDWFKCKFEGGPGTFTPVLYTVLLDSPPHIDKVS